MTTFEFVVSNGAPQKATTAARSHAVKSGLQRKCAAKETGNIKDSQLVIRQKSTLKGRFRVSAVSTKETQPKPTKNGTDPVLPKGKQESAEKTSSQQDRLLRQKYPNGRVSAETQGYSLVKTPNQSWGDPFGTIPISHTQGVDNLIKYFLAYLDLNVSLAQISKLWWGFAISDPLVLHTTLGIVAVEWGMMVPNPKLAYQEGYKQKALAIPRIQERLRKNDLGNAVIGAIANLASMEGLGGEYSTAVIHLKAVDSIIKARGGFSTLVDNASFSSSINWPDLVVAIGTGSKPMFPLVHDWDSVSLPASILAAAEQPSLSHLRVFETFPEDTTMRYTFSILRQALYAARSDQVPSQDLRILFNSVDYRIANLVCSSKESPAQHMLLATAQLFIAYNIRDVHIDCLVPGILISRLVGYLRDRLEAILHLKAYWCGILWCLFTCLASTSPGSEQWRFFRNALSQVIQTAEITEPEQLKVIVQRFLWDDDRSELAFQEYQPIVFPAITENTGEHHENSEVPLLISEEFKRSLNHFRHFGV